MEKRMAQLAYYYYFILSFSVILFSTTTIKALEAKNGVVVNATGDTSNKRIGSDDDMNVPPSTNNSSAVVILRGKDANNLNISDDREKIVHLAELKYDYVQKPFLIAVFLITVCILKALFIRCRWLHEHIPESCMLMLLGLLIGLLFLVKEATDELTFLKFSSHSFFIYLLPPIVLEAAYSLKDRAFAENIGTILLYAVLGTILNVFIVGPPLYALSQFLGSTWSLPFLECLMFSTIVAAVDPVAVLAIFKNMGVNKMLYFLVLGESIFNDGVVVVLYNTISEFMVMDSFGAKEMAMGALRFVCVCVGATTIGIVIGFVTAFITKYTSNVPSIEPLLLYGFSYLSYLVAEMFDFSGIISLICCGLIQAHYAMENISSKSYISMHHFSKVMSNVTESLIFIILSVMAVNARQAWADFNVGFALLAIVLCTIARFIVTYGLAYCVNKWLLGVRKISKKDQFVMAFGGLRGTITFSLAFSLNGDLLAGGEKTKNVLLTTAFVVIFFTTFLQGITMKPLVKYVNVQLHEDETTVFGEINSGVLLHTATALEHITGFRGDNHWSHMTTSFSRRFLRPLVNKHPHKKYNSVFAAYQKSIIESRYTAEQETSGMDYPWQHLGNLDNGGTYINTIPTMDGHWRQLEHLERMRYPNSASAEMVDHQDTLRRQHLKKSDPNSRRGSLAAAQPSSRRASLTPTQPDSPNLDARITEGEVDGLSRIVEGRSTDHANSDLTTRKKNAQNEANGSSMKTASADGALFRGQYKNVAFDDDEKDGERIRKSGHRDE